MGVAYPTGAIVVPFGPEEPQRIPSRCTDLGCRFGGLAEGSQATIYLQVLVDRSGFEPLTSAVQRRRSPN